MAIKEQIDKIIKERKDKRLPIINEKIQFFSRLSEEIIELEDLINTIEYQRQEKSGPYYVMLAGDPGMDMRLRNVSTKEAKKAIDNMLVELERLRKRFSRESISLQVFGMAGSGKSTFIQSVTGLGNDVVLAAGGGHCTGVSSFIYNSDHFEARVYLYTKNELLNLFNMNLSALEIGYNPTTTPRLLHSFDDIKNFTLESVGLPNNLDNRLSVIKYVQNFSLISNLLFGHDANNNPINGLKHDADGSLYIEIRNESQVQQWVAQHNGKKEGDPDYVSYLNYLAVNRVDIYKKFPCEEVGKIVLMDNVGLGDASNDISTEQHMYQAIADNSDAVILLYSPKPEVWRGEVGDINKRLNNIRFKEVYHGIERMDVNELYILLNKREMPSFNNKRDCEDVIPCFKKEPYERKETILVANACDKQSVLDEAVLPVLKQLLNNIDNIDARMVNNTNILGEKTYQEYKMLSDAVTKVVSGALKQNANVTSIFFDEYQNLQLSPQLALLNKKYDKSNLKKDEMECAIIKEEIQKVLRSLLSLCPSKEKILVRLRGGDINAHPENVYNYYSDILRATICDKFEDINNSTINNLQEGVKKEILNVLYSDDGGRLCNIPLSDIADDIDVSEWAKCLIDQKLSDYTFVRNSISDILNYRLSIEGSLEYCVNCSLDYLDPHSTNFIRPNFTGLSEEKCADIIYQSLINSIPTIAEDLMERVSDLLLIPFSSFYSRIKKLRERIIFSEEGQKELRNFYLDNCVTIWKDKFQDAINKQAALGEWNDYSSKLSEKQNKNLFTIKI